MSLVFFTIAAVTLAGAVAAMSLKNLIHCALAAAVSFGGLAAVYLQLGAQFVGFAQVLIYVGAVAILIVFAILLTRGSEPTAQPIFSATWWVGLAIAGLVWISISAAVLLSPANARTATPKPEVAADVAVKNIGHRLMTEYVLPLEILALLLTAATIGAVIIAMHEKETPP